MNYIQLTKENIDTAYICCAMSNKQGKLKREWLKEQLDQGLVYYRSEEKGNCFIEYIPASNAWVPISAPDYLYINCLWVVSSFKGKGYSNDLFEKCIQDVKRQQKKGICIISSVSKKREFLCDGKYLTYKGFLVADHLDCGIDLMYLPLTKDAVIPTFKECVKHPQIDQKGYVIYYTHQCPYAYYWTDRLVEAAKNKGIEIKAILIDTKEKAQNIPAPITNYALFHDGTYITHGMLNEKKFFKLAGIQD